MPTKNKPGQVTDEQIEAAITCKAREVANFTGWDMDTAVKVARQALAMRIASPRPSYNPFNTQKEVVVQSEPIVSKEMFDAVQRKLKEITRHDADD